jgi:SAM-dependent methyltransferase
MYNKDMTKPYLKAIKNPMPELQDAFDREENVLNRFMHYGWINVILDVGCGVGRPLIKLAESYPGKLFVGIDNNPEILSIAKSSSRHLDNILFREADALKLPFDQNMFDMVYSSYNTIGSIDTQRVLLEQHRVTKTGGSILNATWSTNNRTTEFLKKYYPSIGIKIIDMDNTGTNTDKGIFARINPESESLRFEFSRIKGLSFPTIIPCGVWNYMEHTVWHD